MAVNISTCVNISIIFTIVRGRYPQYDRNNAFPNLAVAQNNHHFCSVTNEFLTVVIHTGFPQIPPQRYCVEQQIPGLLACACILI